MNPPRDAMAAQMRVERRVMNWLLAAVVLLIVPIIGLAGWLAYEIQTEPEIVPYVLVLDEETKVIRTIEAKKWAPGVGDYADIARRWIWLTRSKGTDPLLTQRMRDEAKRMTEKSLFPQLQQMTEMMFEKVGDDGIEVDVLLETNPLVVEDGHAVIGVTWGERRYKPTGGAAPSWLRFSGTITMDDIPPKNTGELEANPTGVYVTNFTFHGLAGRVAEAAQ